ncbi:hypothetical protein FHX52_1810 [Humibacillus xanthopallidus]|uniref:Copper(I)-binding protein n=1 Tax=Humibacillus xanthopallidus TaxID=412689 RepID=A0A543PX52_9MICO|nr:copper chaperone PCu(A)C [Humibacillus xanthopallidus]TQN48667.1 hypothetical protein FHX52_1810 [Humibacillus xanthopallidus]
MNRTTTHRLSLSPSVSSPSAPSSPASASSRQRLAPAAALLAAPLVLTACAAGATPGTRVAASAAGAPTSVATATAQHAPEHSRALTLDSGWVKAGSGMTAAFGTITNPADHAVTIVSGSTPTAQMVQLHTMEKQADGSMTMTEKKGGFVVPPHGTLTLSPGGDHLMLMGLTQPLDNGQDVTFSMVATGGETFEWTVPVRSFAGAEETYSPQSPTGTPTMHDMSPTSATP